MGVFKMKKSSLETSHIGRVVSVETNSLGKITCFHIDENGVDYIAHLGDIKDNEYLLYKLRDGEIPLPEGQKLTILQKGDEVEFKPFEKKHAITVIKK
jgi:hypothetical protein